MARWYDAHEKLGKNIDKLKYTEKNLRDFLLSKVMRMIKQHDPHLLDKFVDRFPLDIKRRRWYDQDPYLWLIINGLEYGRQELLDEVGNLLEEEQARQAADKESEE
ncbi:MAG: hypothetical protein KKG47_06320 [Proteobacteria bacterium]|nr:hypothetical protein [Pseudomonadota bacterium]MBU1738442.1 hypothetical protein [Pseudomonadota bacterium]